MAQQHKHAAHSARNPLVKKMAGLLAVAVLAAALYGITAYAWFSDSISNSGNRITAGTYSAGVAVLKDNADTVTDTNRIITSGETGITSWNETFTTDETVFYVRVSNFANSTVSFRYEVELTCGNAKVALSADGGNQTGIGTEGGKAAKDSLGASYHDTYKVTVTPNSGVTGPLDFRIQLRTAYTGAHIEVVGTLQELLDAPKNATVYLNGDIKEPEKILTLTNGSLNLNLGGYTLSLKGLTLPAENFGTMDIENGTLLLNGYTVTDDASAIENGRIKVNLRNLTAETQETTPSETVPTQSTPPETTSVTTSETTTVTASSTEP